MVPRKRSQWRRALWAMLVVALTHPLSSAGQSPESIQPPPICPEGGGGGTEQLQYWCDPNPPGYRFPPSVSLAPHHPDYINPSLCEGCFDAVVTYSTPAYTSLDQERSLTFLFANSQARPTGFVQMDVTDESTSESAVRFSLQVRHSSGSWVTFLNGLQEVHFHAGWGPTRIAGQWDASHLPTGAHSYTAVVRSYFADGSFLQTDVPVRVLVVNERGSPYGLGWSVQGVQRIHPQPNGSAVITGGDGSAAHFAVSYCSSDWYTGIYSCAYNSPAGDFSTLTYVSFGGYASYTRNYPNGTTVTFDASGLHASTQDRYGNTTSFGYTSGRLAAVTDPAGLTTTLGYHPGGGLAWVQDPSGRQVNTVVAYGLLFHFVDPDGAVGLDLHFAGDQLEGYWPRGQARAAGDAARWHFTYDHARRLASLTAPTVNVEGQPARPVVRYVSRETAALPPPGQGTAWSPAPARSTPWVRAEITDARNHTTRLALDRFGAPTRIEEPLGRTTSLTRNAHSQVTELIAPSTQRVEFRWSGPNLIREIDHSVGRVDTMAYVNNRLREHSTRSLNGNVYYPVVTYHYRGVYVDSISVYSGVFGTVGGFPALYPGGRTRHATYVTDSRGRYTAVTDAAGYTTRYHYAPSGWMNTDSVVGPGGRRSAYGYDGHGRVRTIRNPLGHTDTLEYDPMNRVRRHVQPGGIVTHLDYGPVHLTSVTDSKGQVHAFSTNVLGWRETETDPLGRQQHFRYDAMGNRTRWTNRRGQHVEFTYDALNQQASRTADGVTTHYHTDPGRRFRTAHIPGVSTDTIRLDPRGRVVSQVSVHGGRRHVLTSGYGFTNDHRTWVSMSEPWSRSVTYINYTNGQLYQLTDAAGGKTTVGYDSRRLATSYTLPTGNTVSVRYPSSSQPANVSHSNYWLNQSFGVLYQQNRLVHTTSRSNVQGDSVREFGYDALGQLTGFTDFHVQTSTPGCLWRWDPDTGEHCETETIRTPVAQASYGYDGAGNRTDRFASLGHGNRLNAFDGYTYQYDLDGNLARKYWTANPAAFDQHYTWNSLGQLTGVTTNGSAVSYGYNGWGELIRRSDAGGTIRYVYDGGNLFMETVDGWWEPHRVYTHYQEIDRPHSIQIWMPHTGHQTYYYATEHPGNVLGLFNGSNQVVNRYRYDPWGAAELVSESVPNPIRYAGRYRDWGTGLDYNRNRWYDAHAGRFVSQDPIGLAGGINPYAYAENQPMDFTDPYGLLRIPRWVPYVAAFGITAALGIHGGMGVGPALWGTTQAFAATAVGSAMAAGVESAVSGKSFWDTFHRNYGYSVLFLTGGAVVAGAFGGGVTEIGGNGWYQGYVRSAKPIGMAGGLTIGSAAVFSGAGRGDRAAGGGNLGAHERGHTAQFILLSTQGKNPWVAYLLLGALGTTSAGGWWEDSASQAGRR